MNEKFFLLIIMIFFVSSIPFRRVTGPAQTLMVRRIPKRATARRRIYVVRDLRQHLEAIGRAPAPVRGRDRPVLLLTAPRQPQQPAPRVRVPRSRIAACASCPTRPIHRATARRTPPVTRQRPAPRPRAIPQHRHRHHFAATPSTTHSLPSRIERGCAR